MLAYFDEHATEHVTAGTLVPGQAILDFACLEVENDAFNKQDLQLSLRPALNTISLTSSHGANLAEAVRRGLRMTDAQGRLDLLTTIARRCATCVGHRQEGRTLEEWLTRIATTPDPPGVVEQDNARWRDLADAIIRKVDTRHYFLNNSAIVAGGHSSPILRDRQMIWGEADRRGHKHRLLTAPPCFGKSMFALYALEKRAPEVAAVHSISFSHPETQKVGYFVQSLAAQLERHCSVHYVSDVQSWLADIQGCDRLEHDRAALILRQILGHRDRNGRGEEPHLIIVDGLDEGGVAAASLTRLLGDDSIWHAWPAARLVVLAQPLKLFTSPSVLKDDLWEKTALDKEAPIQGEQALEMEAYAQRAIAAAGRAAPDYDPIVGKALVKHVKGNWLLLCHLLHALPACGSANAALAWLRDQPTDVREYLIGKLNRAWSIGPSAAESDARRCVQTLLSLLLAGRFPLPRSHLCNATVQASKRESAAPLSRKRTDELMSLCGQCLDELLARGLVVPAGVARHGPDVPVTFPSASVMTEVLLEKAGEGDIRHGISQSDGYGYWTDYTLWLLQHGGIAGDDMALIAERIAGLSIECLERDLESPITDDQPLFDEAVKAIRILAGLFQLDRTSMAQYTHISMCLPRLNARLFCALAKLDRRSRHSFRIGNASDFLALSAVVEKGANQLPAMFAPLYLLARAGFAASRAISEGAVDEAVGNILSLATSDQLVTRYSLGRAFASAYWNRIATPEDKLHLLHVLETMRDQGDGNYDALETAAYCARFLWSRGTCRDASIAKWHADFGKEMATHTNYNIRMAYGESFVERACEPDRRLSKPEFAVIAGFGELWSSSWPYHREDLSQALGAYALRRLDCTSGGALKSGLVGEGGQLAESPFARFVAKNEQTILNVANRLRLVGDLLQQCRSGQLAAAARLVASNEAGDGTGTSVSGIADVEAPDCLKVAYDCYWRTEQVLESLALLTNSPMQFDAPQIGLLLYPFALHPSWEVTEGVANYVDKIRWEDEAKWEAVIRFLNDRPYWQAKYAAIDAAYDFKDDTELPEGSVFHDLLKQHFDSEDRRLRHICAEDAFLWHKELCPDDGVLPQRALRSWYAAFANHVEWWCENGDDCSLLDEVYQFVRQCMQSDRVRSFEYETGKTIEQFVRSLRVSPVLGPGKGDWWEQERRAWLDGLDERARQHFTGESR